MGGPLVWTFDGPWVTCLADVGRVAASDRTGRQVSSVAVLIELCFGLKRRVDAGDASSRPGANS
jgi:hypothetical protein